jgi:modulator of FtsH protease
MDTFAQAVEGWHDFYLMIGAAAATLVGLLFVSLSLNIDVITREANADLRVLAAQTFTGFLNVVMLAVLFLIPRQVPPGLGLPLLGISGYGLCETVGRFLKTRRARPHGWGRGGIARRFVVPALCFVALTIIAVSVLLGQTGGLYWLVPVMILLIVAASRNAWDLLLRLREPPTES